MALLKGNLEGGSHSVFPLNTHKFAQHFIIGLRDLKSFMRKIINQWRATHPLSRPLPLLRHVSLHRQTCRRFFNPAVLLSLSLLASSISADSVVNAVDAVKVNPVANSAHSSPAAQSLAARLSPPTASAGILYSRYLQAAGNISAENTAWNNFGSFVVRQPEAPFWSETRQHISEAWRQRLSNISLRRQALDIFLAPNANIEAEYRKALLDGGWQSANIFMQQAVRAATKDAKRAGFIRNIELDLQTELGGRFGNIGIDILGALRETNDEAVAWQVRGYRGSKKSQTGGNAGLIYRRVGGGGNLWGVNTFVDYLAHDQGDFWRWGGGGEFRSPWAGLYANYYDAITSPIYWHNAQQERQVTYSADGVDVEINLHSPDVPWFILAAAYYDFTGDFSDSQRQRGARYGIKFAPASIPARVEVEYELEDGKGSVGGSFSFSHQFGKKHSGTGSSGAVFHPQDYFFVAANREYIQRIISHAAPEPPPSEVVWQVEYLSRSGAQLQIDDGVSSARVFSAVSDAFTLTADITVNFTVSNSDKVSISFDYYPVGGNSSVIDSGTLGLQGGMRVAGRRFSLEFDSVLDIEDGRISGLGVELPQITIRTINQGQDISVGARLQVSLSADGTTASVLLLNGTLQVWRNGETRVIGCYTPTNEIAGFTITRRCAVTSSDVRYAASYLHPVVLTGTGPSGIGVYGDESFERVLGVEMYGAPRAGQAGKVRFLAGGYIQDPSVVWDYMRNTPLASLSYAGGAYGVGIGLSVTVRHQTDGIRVSVAAAENMVYFYLEPQILTTYASQAAAYVETARVFVFDPTNLQLQGNEETARIEVQIGRYFGDLIKPEVVVNGVAQSQSGVLKRIAAPNELNLIIATLSLSGGSGMFDSITAESQAAAGAVLNLANQELRFSQEPTISDVRYTLTIAYADPGYFGRITGGNSGSGVILLTVRYLQPLRDFQVNINGNQGAPLIAGGADNFLFSRVSDSNYALEYPIYNGPNTVVVGDLLPARLNVQMQYAGGSDKASVRIIGGNNLVASGLQRISALPRVTDVVQYRITNRVVGDYSQAPSTVKISFVVKVEDPDLPLADGTREFVYTLDLVGNYISSLGFVRPPPPAVVIQTATLTINHAISTSISATPGGGVFTEQVRSGNSIVLRYSPAEYTRTLSNVAYSASSFIYWGAITVQNGVPPYKAQALEPPTRYFTSNPSTLIVTATVNNSVVFTLGTEWQREFPYPFQDYVISDSGGSSITIRLKMHFPAPASPQFSNSFRFVTFFSVNPGSNGGGFLGQYTVVSSVSGAANNFIINRFNPYVYYYTTVAAAIPVGLNNILQLAMGQVPAGFSFVAAPGGGGTVSRSGISFNLGFVWTAGQTRRTFRYYLQNDILSERIPIEINVNTIAIATTPLVVGAATSDDINIDAAVIGGKLSSSSTYTPLETTWELTDKAAQSSIPSTEAMRLYVSGGTSPYRVQAQNGGGVTTIDDEIFAVSVFWNPESPVYQINYRIDDAAGNQIPLNINLSVAGRIVLDSLTMNINVAGDGAVRSRTNGLVSSVVITAQFVTVSLRSPLTFDGYVNAGTLQFINYGRDTTPSLSIRILPISGSGREELRVAPGGDAKAWVLYGRFGDLGTHRFTAQVWAYEGADRGLIREIIFEYDIVNPSSAPPQIYNRVAASYSGVGTRTSPLRFTVPADDGGGYSVLLATVRFPAGVSVALYEPPSWLSEETPAPASLTTSLTMGQRYVAAANGEILLSVLLPAPGQTTLARFVLLVSNQIRVPLEYYVEVVTLSAAQYNLRAIPNEITWPQRGLGVIVADAAISGASTLRFYQDGLLQENVGFRYAGCREVNVGTSGIIGGVGSSGWQTQTAGSGACQFFPASRIEVTRNSSGTAATVVNINADTRPSVRGQSYEVDLLFAPIMPPLANADVRAVANEWRVPVRVRGGVDIDADVRAVGGFLDGTILSDNTIYKGYAAVGNFGISNDLVASLEVRGGGGQVRAYGRAHGLADNPIDPRISVSADGGIYLSRSGFRGQVTLALEDEDPVTPNTLITLNAILLGVNVDRDDRLTVTGLPVRRTSSDGIPTGADRPQFRLTVAHGLARGEAHFSLEKWGLAYSNPNDSGEKLSTDSFGVERAEYFLTDAANFGATEVRGNRIINRTIPSILESRSGGYHSGVIAGYVNGEQKIGVPVTVAIARRNDFNPTAMRILTNQINNVSIAGHGQGTVSITVVGNSFYAGMSPGTNSGGELYNSGARAELFEMINGVEVPSPQNRFGIVSTLGVGGGLFPLLVREFYVSPFLYTLVVKVRQSEQPYLLDRPSGRISPSVFRFTLSIIKPNSQMVAKIPNAINRIDINNFSNAGRSFYTVGSAVVQDSIKNTIVNSMAVFATLTNTNPHLNYNKFSVRFLARGFGINVNADISVYCFRQSVSVVAQSVFYNDAGGAAQNAKVNVVSGIQFYASPVFPINPITITVISDWTDNNGYRNSVSLTVAYNMTARTERYAWPSSAPPTKINLGLPAPDDAKTGLLYPLTDKGTTATNPLTLQEYSAFLVNTRSTSPPPGSDFMSTTCPAFIPATPASLREQDTEGVAAVPPPPTTP